VSELGTDTPKDPTHDAVHLEMLEGLGSLLSSETSLRDHLDHILDLTADAVAGSAAASVTVIDDRGDYITAAASDDEARTMDAVQYELREGPCIDSLETGREHLLPDLDAEGRWPDFAARVRRLGLRSALSMPLHAKHETIGALNVFAGEPHGLDEDDLAMARQIAVPAAVTVANGAAYRRVEQLTTELQTALDNRTVIEQAKGIVAAREGCHPDRAFERLWETARRSDRRLVDVAADVVATTCGSG
jgi:GAF domain-containing protein